MVDAGSADNFHLKQTLVAWVRRMNPEPARQRIEVRRWEALSDGMLDAAVVLVQEGRRPAALQSDTVIARQHTKIDRALAFAATDLGDKVWCSGEAYSLADIALRCYAAVFCPASARSMMPPPRQTRDSYTTTDWPGVTAHCGSANLTSKPPAFAHSISQGESFCR